MKLQLLNATLFQRTENSVYKEIIFTCVSIINFIFAPNNKDTVAILKCQNSC